ncbi:hypothetical protein, partial [Bacillus cereus]|uniref:hypothetical protein n=1 Tax=Bacillus cereus TaxID=1396 RepID=UPI002111DE7A|nr:hypothetical protein [Bacillus cereus]
AGLCRLVSAAHHIRGCPVITPELLVEHTQTAAGQLITLLGSDSDVGLAVAAGDRRGAEHLLQAWQHRLGDSLRLAVTN